MLSLLPNSIHFIIYKHWIAGWREQGQADLDSRFTFSLPAFPPAFPFRMRWHVLRLGRQEFRAIGCKDRISVLFLATPLPFPFCTRDRPGDLPDARGEPASVQGSSLGKEEFAKCQRERERWTDGRKTSIENICKEKSARLPLVRSLTTRYLRLLWSSTNTSFRKTLVFRSIELSLMTRLPTIERLRLN